MRRVEADEVEVDDEVVVVVGLIPPAPSLTFSTRCSEEEEEEGPIASPTMIDRSDAVSSPSLHM